MLKFTSQCFISKQDRKAPIYALELMRWCWEQEADKRPTSSEILAMSRAPEFPRLSDVLSFDRKVGLGCVVTTDSRSHIGEGVDGKPSIGSTAWLCRTNEGKCNSKVDIVKYSSGRCELVEVKRAQLISYVSLIES